MYVHEVGAPHLIDPSRLLASASRIYGDRMQELWGEVRAAPAEQVPDEHREPVANYFRRLGDEGGDDGGN